MADEDIALSQSTAPISPDRREQISQGWTLSLAYATFGCVIGASFQFGYSTGVLNTPETVFQDFYNETYLSRSADNAEGISEGLLTTLWSVTVSIFCIGGMLGGFFGGQLASRFGRKRTMLLNNITMLVAVCFMFTCKFAMSYEMLIIGRFFVGLHSGVSTVVAPLYLLEVAPLALKGAAGTLSQLAIVLGILISQSLGLNDALGSKETFFYLLLMPLGPALLQVAILACCPESPAWLLIYRNDFASARSALEQLRKSDDVNAEMDTLESELRQQKSLEQVPFQNLFTVRYLRTPLIIAACMQLSQQLSGVNAVLYYSTGIFLSAGLKPSYAQYATLGIGGVMVVMTFISVLLIDRLGRRVLHLTGLGGMLVCMIMLMVTVSLENDWVRYLSVASVILFIVFFTSGPGAIPWFITAELFEQDARPHAMGVATLVNWLANFAVGLLFPLMQRTMSFYAFLPFIILLVFFWVFTYIMVPETKNKPVEQTVAQFKARRR